MSENLDYLRQIWTPRVYLAILAVVLAAFIPEIAYTTFSHDYFYTTYLTYDAYSADGRYLAEVVRLLSFGFLPPNLLMMLGLACMVGCGLVFCRLLAVTHWAPIIIACCLFATFPMMFEVWSYTAIRFTVPLAALLAMLALGVPSLPIGAILICAALATYQSAIYLAVVAAFYVTAYRTAKGEPAFRDFAFPRAAMVVAGLLLYGSLYFVLNRYYVEGSRIAGFVRIVANLGQFIATAKIILQATIELYGRGVFLFPTIAKYAFLILTAILIGTLAKGRSAVGIVLVLTAPLCIFGAAWIMSPPTQMLSDRILFSFVGIYTGTFLIAWLLTSGRVRSFVAMLGALLVAIFVLQANNWHQFMDLRNRADMETTEEIASRIKELPGYRAGMPITVLGTMQDKNYLPFRLFNPYGSRQIVGNTMMASMYSQEWASTRALMFFFPLDNFPSPEVVKSARTASGDMPVWPAPGSVAERNQMIIVKLK